MSKLSTAKGMSHIEAWASQCAKVLVQEIDKRIYETMVNPAHGRTIRVRVFVGPTEYGQLRMGQTIDKIANKTVYESVIASLSDEIARAVVDFGDVKIDTQNNPLFDDKQFVVTVSIGVHSPKD